MASLLAVFECLSARQQRGVIRISGEPKRSSEVITRQLSALEKAKPESLNVAWFTLPESLVDQSDTRKNEWRLKKYKTYLGEEYDVVIIDLHQGLNLEAIGALSGTIKLGGALILITPDDKTWLNQPDPEAQRIASYPYTETDMGHATLLYFIRSMKQAEGVFHYELSASSTKLELQKRGDVLHLTSNTKSSLNTQNHRYLTADQANASTKLRKQLSQDQSITVLTADRGRGKSALLGMTLADFTASNIAKEFKVAVVCANATSLNVLTKHYKNRLKELAKSGVIDDDITSYIDHLVRLAPDSDCLNDVSKGSQSSEKFDLIVIDEAASFPLSIVKAASNRTSKLVLATTVHGYEGTGRGFEYKLKPFLKSKAETNTDISYQEVSMHQPIRWSEGDGLEQWTNEALLLNANLSNVKNVDWSEGKPHLNFLELDSTSMLDSGLMKEVFALLIQAHYQTTPSDLRAMLDAPDIKTLVVTTQSKDEPNKPIVIATAMISIEGRLPDELGEQIWQGRRRPRGHLAPQSLVAHCGYKSAHRYRYARVVRIAVHPELQGQGLGSKLLGHIYLSAQSKGIDFLATSFGISEPLLSFWADNSFVPVRLGLRPETSTGDVSVLMLKPVLPIDQTNSEQKDQSQNKSNQNYRSVLDLSRWNKRFKQTLNAEIGLTLRAQSIHEDIVELLTVDQEELKRVQSLSSSRIGSSPGDANKQDAEFQSWTEEQSLLDIEAFAFHFRSVDSCVLAFSWALLQISPPDRPFNDKGLNSSAIESMRFLRGKFVQGLTNKKLIERFQLSGEKQLIQKMRAEAQLLLATL